MKNLFFILFNIVNANMIMPWLYTSNVDCGGLASRFDYIINHTSYFSAVSPTSYYISNDGKELKLWDSGCPGTTLEQYAQKFLEQNIKVFPHVAYDSINITSLRNGILNNKTVQHKFITELREKAQKYNYTGYSLDMFPNNDELGYITPEDGENYAILADALSQELHKYNKQLRVYVEPGDLFSNIDLLTQTNVDLILSQAYEYSIDVGEFQRKLDYSVAHIHKDKLGIGICSKCLSHGHFTAAALTYRFQQLKNANITEMGIWASDVPESWLIYLEKFLN